MAKNNAKKVESKSGVKGAVLEGDTLSINPDDTEFRKPGKVRKGKINPETNEIEYEDEAEETPPAPKAADKPKKPKGDTEAKLEVNFDEGTVKLKPSQRPTPPASQRKVVEPPKDKNVEVVTINDLIERYGMDGKKIRRIVRNCGYKAPETHTQGFGAKARYEFDPNSKVYKDIISALDEEVG